MKTHLYVAASAAALMLLGACATTPLDAASSSAMADGTQRVYYDGFYGTLDSGDWGVDGSFYYRDGTGRYVRDYDGHIRSSPGTGYVMTDVKRGH